MNSLVHFIHLYMNLLPIPIACIPTLIPRIHPPISYIFTLIPRILLIPFPDSPFRLLHIAYYEA